MRLGRSKWFTDMRAELLQRVEARLTRFNEVEFSPEQQTAIDYYAVFQNGNRPEEQCQ
jgi:hypothetical protein